VYVAKQKNTKRAWSGEGAKCTVYLGGGNKKLPGETGGLKPQEEQDFKGGDLFRAPEISSKTLLRIMGVAPSDKVGPVCRPR